MEAAKSGVDFVALEPRGFLRLRLGDLISKGPRSLQSDLVGIAVLAGTLPASSTCGLRAMLSAARFPLKETKTAAKITLPMANGVQGIRVASMFT